MTRFEFTSLNVGPFQFSKEFNGLVLVCTELLYGRPQGWICVVNNPMCGLFAGIGINIEVVCLFDFGFRCMAKNDLRKCAVKPFNPALQRLEEALLLALNRLGDPLLVFPEFRVRLAHAADHQRHQLVDARLAQTEQVSVARSAAQNLADHVAAPGVAQAHAVGHRHADGPDVLGDHAVRNALLAFVGLARQFGNFFDQRQEHVVAVKVRHVLHHAGDALQAHAGVDVLERQIAQGRRAAFLRFLALELRKHQVPDLQEAGALTGLEVIGPAVVAVGFAPVIVDLAARPAGTVGAFERRVGGPEVLVGPEAVNVTGVQADVLRPVPERLVVILVDGDVHLGRVHSHPLTAGQKFPGPGDRLAFEVIAEREVAHHLEQRQVTAGAAHVFDVAHPNAFLGGGDPLAFPALEAGRRAHKLRLERLHARHGKQGGGIGSDGRVRGQAQMLFGFEKCQKFFADLSGGQCSSHTGKYTGGPPEGRARSGARQLRWPALGLQPWSASP